MRTSKEVADDIKKTVARRTRQQHTTYPLYALKVTKSANAFLAPVLSFDDKTALGALKELVKTNPALERSYLYQVGTFCTYDGTVKPCKPRLVKNDEN